MVENEELIILHTTKCSDSSIVVHAICRDSGREGLLVRGVGKAGKGMAMFLPLNIVEADIVRTPRSSMPLAKNFSCSLPLSDIRNNIFKNTVTLFISEVLFKVLRENTMEPGLYEWCRRQILILNALGGDFANFHLLFLTGLCGQLGFAPEAGDLMPFAGENLDKITGLLEKTFAEAMLIPMTGRERGEIAENLIAYLEFHAETAVNINSLKVLKELFATV